MTKLRATKGRDRPSGVTGVASPLTGVASMLGATSRDGGVDLMWNSLHQGTEVQYVFSRTSGDISLDYSSSYPSMRVSRVKFNTWVQAAQLLVLLARD